LSRVFRLAVEAFAQLQGEPVAIVECPHALRSFTELRSLTPAECTRIVVRDLEELARFYRCFYSAGGRLIFRTAVNAETLYALRRQLEAIKISHAALHGRRVAFVRDQHQGFYACGSWQARQDSSNLQRRVVVISDNARYHKAVAHLAWREQHAAEFALDFLPPYSPELNPIERVWKLTRRLCLHNCYFDALDYVITAVEEQFNKWTDASETLRRLCAIN